MGRGKKKLKPPKEEEKDHILKLPTHITIDIFSSLPIKTIGHCACVCKAWRSVLSDPCFPQIHLPKSPVNLMLCNISQRCWLIEFDGKDFSKLKRKVSKFWDEDVALDFPDMDVVGSCNGLLCLEDTFNDFCVWNPVRNDHVILPGPNIKSGYRLAAAFGFCPRTNVYKVIRMVQYDKAAMPLASENDENDKAMCEVYTLGSSNARWRTIEDVPIPSYRRNCEMLNGAVHWFCAFPINDETLWICAFRIEDEKWDPILLPLSLLQGFDSMHLDLEWLKVGVLENCLCIFDYTEDSSLNIWMMKDYGARESWTKSWSIQQTQLPSEIHVYSLLPLKLTNDGELLMFDDSNPTLVCFDPQKGLTTQKQRVYGVRKHGRGDSMAFVASFLSPTQVMNEE